MRDATSAFIAASSGESTEPVTLAIITDNDGESYYFSDGDVGTDDGLSHNYAPVIASTGEIGIDSDALGSIRDGGIFAETVTVDVVICAQSTAFVQFVVAHGADKLELSLYRWFRGTADGDKLLLGRFYGQAPISVNEGNMICSVGFVGMIDKLNRRTILYHDVIIGAATFYLPFNDFWDSRSTLEQSREPDRGNFVRLQEDLDYLKMGKVAISGYGNPPGSTTGTYMVIDEERLAISVSPLGEITITNRGIGGTEARPHLRGALIKTSARTFNHYIGKDVFAAIPSIPAQVWFDDVLQTGNFRVSSDGVLRIRRLPSVRTIVKAAPLTRGETIHHTGAQGSGHVETYTPNGSPGTFHNPENISTANDFYFEHKEIIVGNPPPNDTHYTARCYCAHAPGTDGVVGTVDNVIVSIDYSVATGNDPKIRRTLGLTIRYTDDNGDEIIDTPITKSVTAGDTGTLTADFSSHITTTERLAAVEIGVEVQRHKDNSDPNNLPGVFELHVDYSAGLLWSFNVVPAPEVQPDYHILVPPDVIKVVATSPTLGTNPTPPQVVKALINYRAHGTIAIDNASFNSASIAYSNHQWGLGGIIKKDTIVADAVREIMFLACGALSTYGGALKFVSAYDLEATSGSDASVSSGEMVLRSRAIEYMGTQGIINSVRVTSTQNLHDTGWVDSDSASYYGKSELSFSTSLAGGTGLGMMISMFINQRATPVLLYKIEVFQKLGLRLERGDRVTVPSYYGVDSGVVIDVRRRLGNGVNGEMSTHTVYIIVKTTFQSGGGGWS